MKKLLLTFSLMVMAFVGFSQIDLAVDTNKTTIDIQRPTFSENANTVNGIQLESGALVLDDDDASYGTMIRFGIGKRVELRTQTDWDTGFNVGVKVNLFQSTERWMPDVAVLSFFDENPFGAIMVTDYRVVADFDDMIDRLGVTLNYGKGIDIYAEDEDEDEAGVDEEGADEYYVINNYFNAVVRYQVLDRVEAFGEVQVREDDLNYNVGFIALANNRWAIDVHGGSILIDGDASPFFGGGVSFAVK
jgi:hypothetical protein